MQVRYGARRWRAHRGGVVAADIARRVLAPPRRETAVQTATADFNALDESSQIESHDLTAYRGSNAVVRRAMATQELGSA